MNSLNNHKRKDVVEHYINGALQRFTTLKKSFRDLTDQIPPEVITESMKKKIHDITLIFEKQEKEFYADIAEILKHIK